MNALVYEGAWQMPLREIEPPQPGPQDAIVSVQAVGICGSDVHGYMGITGRRKPPIVMGHEFSGIVTAAGDAVKNFPVGTRVVAEPLLTCGQCDNCRAGRPNICLYRGGLGITLNGAYAESVCVPQKMLHRLPDDMTWEQGALVEPLSVALHAVNLTPFELMETVVVIGAGTIGLLTLLAARLKGAGKVIVTDANAHRLAMARELGADIALNVTGGDPVPVIQAETSGAGASAVIEAVGIPATAQQSLAAARPGAHVTWIGNSHPNVEISMQSIVTRELTLHGAYGFNQEFARAIEIIRTDRLPVKRLIEMSAPLQDGTRIIDDLAKGNLDAVKVILYPNTPTPAVLP